VSARAVSCWDEEYPRLYLRREGGWCCSSWGAWVGFVALKAFGIGRLGRRIVRGEMQDAYVVHIFDSMVASQELDWLVWWLC
jgi:hypothetical protein